MLALVFVIGFTLGFAMAWLISSTGACSRIWTKIETPPQLCVPFHAL
jgi:hypothetical protein